MINTAAQVNITKQHKAILHMILYFDIFKTPLRLEDVVLNCGFPITTEEAKRALNELLTYGYLKKVKDHFMPCWADVYNVARRLKGKANAQEVMNDALVCSRRASRMPFVKGLCISGSLSKDHFDERSDVDFFVITKADRLWICRGMYWLFYRLTPQSRRHFYCLNYFISESDLKIEDKNIFVATELAHLIPTYGYASYEQLMRTNAWYKKYVPNRPLHKGGICDNSENGFLKRAFEALFAGKLGDVLDDFLHKATAKRWTKKHKGDMDKAQFEVQYRARKHVAKRHSKGHQEKVLNILAQKIKDMEDTFQQKLN